MKVMIIIFEALLILFAIYAYLRNYLTNTLGDLRFQLICARQRQLLVSYAKNPNEELVELCNEEVQELEMETSEFAQKWKFFIGRNPVSIFDGEILKKKLEIEEMKYEFKNEN